MDIQNYKTLAGISMAEVPTRLDAELPKEAYKGVPGAADLTDIDPNYMRKVLNEVFGLCGTGWGYRYDSSDMHTEIEQRPRSSGQGTRRVYVATLKRLTFWYKLNDADGSVLTCEIDASGGSENDVEAYAMKGAITNALGHASSNIGFQESVYLGKRSHKTTGRKPAAPAASKPAAAVPATKPAPASKATPTLAAPAVDNSTSFLVSIGKRAGKTLAEIYAEGEDGAKAIQFYTTMATGNNSAKEALKNAAIGFLARNNGHVPQSVAA